MLLLPAYLTLIFFQNVGDNFTYLNYQFLEKQLNYHVGLKPYFYVILKIEWKLEFFLIILSCSNDLQWQLDMREKRILLRPLGQKPFFILIPMYIINVISQTWKCMTILVYWLIRKKYCSKVLYSSNNIRKAKNQHLNIVCQHLIGQFHDV